MRRLRPQWLDALTPSDDDSTTSVAPSYLDAALAFRKNAELQRLALYRAVTLSSSVSASCS
jgi:hypothetical protein